jgi:hypothetical protein
MKSITNRRSVLTKLFGALQQCTVTATSIDPNKHTILSQNAILSLDAKTMTAVRKEVVKLRGCSEGASFTVEELEQLLLVTAAQSIQSTRSDQGNASAAIADFIAQLARRVGRYLVPFATPGLRMRPLPTPHESFRIGSCEFSSNPKRARRIFNAIRIPTKFLVKQQHAFPKQGTLVLPKGGTIAIVEVTTSTGFATSAALGSLEEAYGYFVLFYDAVSTLRSKGARPRMPLVSWQRRPGLAPLCRVATEPTAIPSMLRFGVGFDQLWHEGYDVDVLAAQPRLRALGFFEKEQELFHSYAQTDMAGRIRTALRWLCRSLQEWEPETRFLDLAIALEALFTAPSADYKISALIRDCVGNAVRWSNPEEIRPLMSRLYGRRSGIVHQGSLTQFYGEIEDLYVIAVQCLHELLEAGDHRGGYQDMLKRLGLDLGAYRHDEPQGASTEDKTLPESHSSAAP